MQFLVLCRYEIGGTLLKAFNSPNKRLNQRLRPLTKLLHSKVRRVQSNYAQFSTNSNHSVQWINPLHVPHMLLKLVQPTIPQRRSLTYVRNRVGYVNVDPRSIMGRVMSELPKDDLVFTKARGMLFLRPKGKPEASGTVTRDEGRPGQGRQDIWVHSVGVGSFLFFYSSCLFLSLLPSHHICLPVFVPNAN